MSCDFLYRKKYVIGSWRNVFVVSHIHYTKYRIKIPFYFYKSEIIHYMKSFIIQEYRACLFNFFILFIEILRSGKSLINFRIRHSNMNIWWSSCLGFNLQVKHDQCLLSLSDDENQQVCWSKDEPVKIDFPFRSIQFKIQFPKKKKNYDFSFHPFWFVHICICKYMCMYV